jgi:hypothetical protein
MSLYIKHDVTPVQATKVYTGNGGIAPLILSLGARREWSVSRLSLFTLLPVS